MDRKLPLAVTGFLIVLLVGLLTPILNAQVQTFAYAGDAIAAASTFPSVASEVATTERVLPAPGINRSLDRQIYVRTVRVAWCPEHRRFYLLEPPLPGVTLTRVTHYRRLYDTPLRDAVFGRYRTTIEHVRPHPRL